MSDSDVKRERLVPVTCDACGAENLRYSDDRWGDERVVQLTCDACHAVHLDERLVREKVSATVSTRDFCGQITVGSIWAKGGG